MSTRLRKVAPKFAPKTWQRPPSDRLLTELCRRVVVELRDQNTCQRCGRTDRRLEWAHRITRNAPSIIYVPWNSLALCGPRKYSWSCHYWFDSHKDASAEWWQNKWPDRAAMLDAWRRSEPHRVDRQLDKLWLEQELARLTA